MQIFGILPIAGRGVDVGVAHEGSFLLVLKPLRELLRLAAPALCRRPARILKMALDTLAHALARSVDDAEIDVSSVARDPIQAQLARFGEWGGCWPVVVEVADADGRRPAERGADWREDRRAFVTGLVREVLPGVLRVPQRRAKRLI